MKRASTNILRAAHGFTLVEAMIAVAVLMLGVLVLEKNFVAQIMGNNSARMSTNAVAAASSFLETLRSLPLNDAQLQDAHGVIHDHLLDHGANCANPDIDMNNTIGADGKVVAADFAVNWDEGRDKDFFIFHRGGTLEPHGLFTVFWNVCNNPNAANTRQIRAIIRWRDNNRVSNVANDPRNNQQVVMNYVHGAL